MSLRRAMHAAAVSAAALVLVACGEATVSTSGDGPVYDTVSALTGEADLVIRGAALEVVHAGEDCGGSDPATEGQCLPYEMWSVRTDAVLAGAAPAEVFLAWPVARGGDGDLVPLRPRQPLVLFLHERDSSVSAPAGYPQSYVPFHADQGVFEVAGTVATARSHLVRGLMEPTVAAGRLSVPVADLVAAVVDTREE